MAQDGNSAPGRGIPISLNVYDLMPPSGLATFLWTVGLSINHSGVVIDDREWAFGGHDVEGLTGVFSTQPRDVPEHALFKTTLPIGICRLSDGEIDDVLDQLKAEYTGTSYDLLSRNCNHFSAALTAALCDGAVPPAWINRIAGLGARLPVCVSGAWVEPPTADLTDLEDDSHRLLPPSEVAPMAHGHDTEDAATSTRYSSSSTRTFASR